jgi:hypothetical protein
MAEDLIETAGRLMDLRPLVPRETLNRLLGNTSIPLGAKARVEFKRLTARLKSCPDTKHRFFAVCKAHIDFAGFTYGLYRLRKNSRFLLH